MYGIVGKLGALATDRMILSFAPKNFFYSTLKKVGELFPGKSKTTRAYLHPEEVSATSPYRVTVTARTMT